MKKAFYWLLVVVLVVLNLVQFYRSRNVSARPAIVLAWSEGYGYFAEEGSFEAFSETVTSDDFIRSITDKPKYKSIRKRFLEDWNPEVTRSKVSDLYGKPSNLYWGRERRLLTELIDDLYGAMKVELHSYQK